MTSAQTIKTKKNTKLFTVNEIVTYGIVLSAFIVVMILNQLGVLSRHVQSMLIPVCYNIILAVSLNMTVGFLGELTLGHAGFMSVGAYSGCILSIALVDVLPTAIRFPVAMLFGGLVAALFGVIIGIPVLRLRGDYLAIVTLAFGEIIKGIVMVLGFTGGASGLKTSAIHNATFPVAFILVIITIFVAMNLKRSKHGRAVMAIRDNRIAAEAAGINVTYYKLLIFVIAAFFAGVAGVIYGHNVTIVQAGDFDYNMSIELLVIVVLGGMGSIRGSIIAAAILTVLPEMLRGFADYRMLIYSLVLIVIMIFNAAPIFDSAKSKLNFKYLIGLIKKSIARKRSKKEADGTK